MASDPKLVAVLEARLDKFEKSLVEAGKVVDREIDEIENKFSRRAGNIGQTFGSRFIAAFSTVTITGLITALSVSLDRLAALGDRAADFRLPVEELQALELGARVSSVTVGELNRAMETFANVSKTSGRQAEVFYDALEKISPGLARAFENAPTQSARLRLVMDALAGTQDEVKKATLAFAAFGTDADRVIDFFSRGSVGIDDFKKRAQALGITITDAMVKNASEAQNHLTTLAQVIQNKLLIAVAEVIPALQRMIPVLENVGRIIRDALESFVDIEVRSTSGLKDLLDTNERILNQAEQRYAELVQSLKDKPPSGLAKLLGDAREEELAELDKTIKKYRDAVYKIQAIIEARAQTTPNTTPPPTGPARPAFSRRDDTRRQGSDPFERQIEQMNKRISLWDAEAQAIGKSTFEQDRLRAVAELQHAAQKAGLDENNPKIFEMAQRYAEAAERVRLLKDQWDAANALAKEFGNAAIDGIDALVTKSKSLNQVLADTLRTFARMAAQAAILGQGPLAQFFGTAPAVKGGVGGLFGGLASGLFGLFGGGRAAGGDVEPGKYYVVGEKRPEIFVPGTAGRILPNKPQQELNRPQLVMNNDFRDASAQAIPAILMRLNTLERSLPDLVPRLVTDSRRTNPWGG